MRSRFFAWIVGPLAVVVTCSCAPASSQMPPAPIDTSVSASTAVIDTFTPERVAPTSTRTIQVPAVATSRGPNLEATDPATVSLASGQLQLVEFFRFT